MAELTREQVIAEAQKGSPLDRRDLRELDLSGIKLDGANLRRSELDGTILEKTRLVGANLSNASLREAYLAEAELSQANLEKADLECANLKNAKLAGANLVRANLAGAIAEGAHLFGAQLSFAQMDTAKLGLAELSEANLSHADLTEAYLGGVRLVRANLTGARLERANLEEADLERAVLVDARVASAILAGARLVSANLSGSDFSRADLTNADLSGADLRRAILDGARLEKTNLTGARVFGLSIKQTALDAVTVEWIDISSAGDGSQRLQGREALDHLSGRAPKDASPAGRRYFGKGDIMRDATLVFGADAYVEIESRFENCTITLGDGAELVVAREGVLQGCNVNGSGRLTVHGFFSEGKAPGIAGARQIYVSAHGGVNATVQQLLQPTRFGFEPGCRLRLRILETTR